jgi:hypothetical protein
MPEIFYFGRGPRTLLGLRHPPIARPRASMLVCTPLLQEGIRCQRALWSLSEALATAGIDVLRFDWFGSGDSAGTSVDIDVPGLVDDIAAAEFLMRTSADAGQAGLARPRLFGLRSAALPLLAYASARREPVDVVLWAPALDGRALAAAWREQHRRQLHTAGRFLSAETASEDDELLGFVIDRDLLEDFGAWHGSDLLLPAGSRLVIAQWPASPVDEAFVDAQRDAGVMVEHFDLDGADEPAWDDPDQFETQIFPRQAVTQLARHLAEAA